MVQLVVNVVDEWLWFATSFYVYLISAIADLGQLLQSYRLGRVFALHGILDNLSVLICSNNAFHSDGVDPIAISRVVPYLWFTLVDRVPVFGEWHITDHAYNRVDSVLTDALLLEQFASIVVVTVFGEVFFVVGIMQKTSQNDVLHLRGANIINSLHCLHSMAHNNEGMVDAVSIVHVVLREDLGQLLDARLQSGGIVFELVHFVGYYKAGEFE